MIGGIEAAIAEDRLDEDGNLWQPGMIGGIEAAIAEDRLDEDGNLWQPQEEDPTMNRECAAPFMVTPYRGEGVQWLHEGYHVVMGSRVYRRVLKQAHVEAGTRPAGQLDIFMGIVVGVDCCKCACGYMGGWIGGHSRPFKTACAVVRSSTVVVMQASTRCLRVACLGYRSKRCCRA